MTSQQLPAQAGLIGDHEIRDLLHSGSALHLAFQPQVDLRSGEIVSVEALARWRHPIFGEVAPAAFIPAIHRLGWQTALFERICERALEAILLLDEAGLGIPIAINACARTLSDPRNRVFLRDAAARLGVPLSRLCVELTEDAPADDLSELCVALTQLRSWGCKVALDDFGAGHANLELLMGLEIDELKLDRQLVSHINDNVVALESVRFALALGKNMNWRVLAEGVSTEAEFRMLQLLGCEYGQGYLLGHPMSLARLISVIAAGAGDLAPRKGEPVWLPNPPATLAAPH